MFVWDTALGEKTHRAYKLHKCLLKTQVLLAPGLNMTLFIRELNIIHPRSCLTISQRSLNTCILSHMTKAPQFQEAPRKDFDYITFLKNTNGPPLEWKEH